MYSRLRLEMLGAERARILEIRKTGNVAAEVVGEVLAMLDVEESMLEAATQEREELSAPGSSPRRTGDDCEHLASYPAIDTTPEPVCQQCIAEDVQWVSLRECLICGRVGCCDSSPRRHADAHFRDTGVASKVVTLADAGTVELWVQHFGTRC